MYPILIATLMAATFLLLSNTGIVANPMSRPSPMTKQYEAYSYSHGEDFVMFMAGVQRMISKYDYDPADVAFGEISAEMIAAGGNWTVTWDNMNVFLGASAYAGGIGLTRASLYPPNYQPSGPWNVTLISRVDAVGVPTGEIGAFVAWADPAAAGMPQLDAGGFMMGLKQMIGHSENAGINRGGRLMSRGAYAASVAFPGGAYTTMNNIPAVIPNGAIVYIQCRLADDLGPDGVPGTGDDAADQFCE
jgi:hypothetical protein